MNPTFLARPEASPGEELSLAHLCFPGTRQRTSPKVGTQENVTGCVCTDGWEDGWTDKLMGRGMEGRLAGWVDG